MKHGLLGRFKSLFQRHGTLLRYSGSSIVLQAASLLCSVVILRWLPPAEMGLWQALVLIQTYSALAQAGVLNGLNRELPFSLGAGKQNRVQRLAGTAQTVAIVGATLLILGAIPALFLAKSALSRLCVSCVFLASAAQLYRNYLAVTYRSEMAFESLARITILETVLTVLTLPAVYYFRLSGYAFRFAFLFVSMALVNHWFRPLRVRSTLDWSSLSSLLKTGVPIFAFGYLLTVANTFPRLILLSSGGVTLLGLFAPAWVLAGVLQTVPVTLATYIYPQMTYRLGRTGSPRSLRPMAFKTALGTLLVALPIVVTLALTVPPLITRFFPAYKDSVGAIKWTLLAGAFMGASVAINALNSLKAWGWMAAYTLIKCVCSLTIPWGAFAVWHTLDSLAAGIALAEALGFCAGLWAIDKAISLSPSVVAQDALTVATNHAV